MNPLKALYAIFFREGSNEVAVIPKTSNFMAFGKNRDEAAKKLLKNEIPDSYKTTKKEAEKHLDSVFTKKEQKKGNMEVKKIK